MKWLRYVGIAFTFLFVLLVVASIAFPYMLRAKVNSQIAEIKAKGEPVSTADLAGPKIPDSENAAVIYMQAFKLISSPEAEKEIGEASALLSQKKREENPELWDKARQVVDRYHGALVLAEKAVSRPKCQFPVNWGDSPDKIARPHLSEIRKLTRLTAIQALLDARAGKMDDAVRSIELGLKVSESLKSEPMIIGQIVRIACLTIASGNLQECLHYGDLNEALSKRLFLSFDSIELSDSITSAMEDERAFGISCFRVTRENPFSMTDASDSILDNSNRKASRNPRRPGAFWVSFTCADELFYLKTMDEYIDRANLSYQEIKARFPNIDNGPKMPRYALISSILLPVFSKGGLKRDIEIAEIRGNQIMLALLAYKDRFGSYPRNLTELRTKLGWALKEDPFSGKDFIYRKRGRGFILYSIGENLKDDGAKTVPSPIGPLVPDKENVLSSYPYQTPDGQKSADKIWTMER